MDLTSAMTIEAWQGILGVIITLGTILSSVGGFLVWVAKKVHGFVKLQTKLIEKTTEHTEAIKLLADAVKMLSEKQKQSEHQLSMREQETMKLEGKVETSNKMMMALTGDLRSTTASLDGLWRTLQVLHPDRVPKRLSDR